MKRISLFTLFLLLALSLPFCINVTKGRYYDSYGMNEQQQKVYDKIHEGLGPSVWMRTFDLNSKIITLYEEGRNQNSYYEDRIDALNDSLYNRQQEIKILKIWNSLLSVSVIVLAITTVVLFRSKEK